MGVQEDTIVYLFPKKSSKRKSNKKGKSKTSRSSSPVRLSRSYSTPSVSSKRTIRIDRSPSPKRKEQLNLLVVKL